MRAVSLTFLRKSMPCLRRNKSIPVGAMAGDLQILHSFRYQTLQPVGQPALQVLWPPVQLHLMSDRTVVYGCGPRHGSWNLDETREELSVTFHYSGDNQRAIRHDFSRIADSSTLALVRANGHVRTDAIVVEMVGLQTVSNASDGSKRPRCMSEGQVMLLHDLQGQQVLTLVVKTAKS